MTRPKKRLAIFSIMQFEPVFFWIWLRHYQKYAPGVDLYVLNHHVPDEDLEDRGDEFRFAGNVYGYYETAGEMEKEVIVVPVHRNAAFDHAWLRDTVQEFQRFLLQSYDWVLFAEADELVMPRPTLTGDESLVEYLDTINSPAVRCDGYEVVHRYAGTDAEPPYAGPIRHEGPLLFNREWWYSSEIYSKTLLTSIPLTYDIGFHRVTGSAAAAVPRQKRHDLLLVHLHKVDFGLALAKSQHAARRTWSKVDVDNNFGYQNRIVDEEKLRAYFATNIDNMSSPANLVRIPDEVRTSI